ncbi:uncharacterized protein LOC128662598 isoform X2 [Bombina bombina]|uniref:uncharacterized protein LOC128662598 isoform X2 n=1 Tax=Bombina bombina TaxID=8345 RepID=UPI00235A5542|nr:uncharacterized protein LOC128662598 isoform X2 [Bombina bombina]
MKLRFGENIETIETTRQARKSGTARYEKATINNEIEKDRIKTTPNDVSTKQAVKRITTQKYQFTGHSKNASGSTISTLTKGYETSTNRDIFSPETVTTEAKSQSWKSFTQQPEHSTKVNDFTTDKSNLKTLDVSLEPHVNSTMDNVNQAMGQPINASGFHQEKAITGGLVLLFIVILVVAILLYIKYRKQRNPLPDDQTRQQVQANSSTRQEDSSEEEEATSFL